MKIVTRKELGDLGNHISSINGVVEYTLGEKSFLLIRYSPGYAIIDYSGPVDQNGVATRKVLKSFQNTRTLMKYMIEESGAEEYTLEP